jgi:hypothetical protein
MGISGKDVELLIRLRRDGYLPDRASVIEIGAQQISNSVLRDPSPVVELGHLFGVGSPAPLPAPLPFTRTPEGLERQPADAPLARDLWMWLGFSYASIDVDGTLGAIPLDLNYATVPSALARKHHLVTNFGTTEHVANQLNAFKIVHDLAAPNGVMIHNLPSQGGFNHGLVNYTPKFFWALARSNDYRWLFFDFMADSTTYPVPDNLIEAVKPFHPEIAESAAGYRAAECSLCVAFQKRGNGRFSPPIDGPPAEAGADKPAGRFWSKLKRLAQPLM